MPDTDHTSLTARQILRIVLTILAPERSFLVLAVVYGIGISLLSLATPIAVQVLINTVAYTGLALPLVVLTVTLFGLLLASGLLNALRVHLMEIFARRFYARMVSEITLRAIYARNPFFADDGRGALFNRYFDIVSVQKAIPVLFIGGFTVLLQAAVGFVLVSFYHPLFLAFVTIVILLIWAIWLLWGASAVRRAVALSQAKHRAAAWLEGLGASNGYFKSDRHIAYALTRTDAVTADYIRAHEAHFRRHFAQTIAFLVLYAAASAALLGLGGWLVIQGQLTLGQLVAAELVLSAAFYGVSQLGTYLNYFYDLCAACEELSLFQAVEQEAPSGQEQALPDDAQLVFNNVRGDARGEPARLDLALPSGALIQAAAASHGVQRLFTNLLKRFDDPASGSLTIGGHELRSIEIHLLRRNVVVLDRPGLIEASIREYLSLAHEGISSMDMLAALEKVGLGAALRQLPGGLDTELSSTGWPLSIAEAMRLKLAGALLACPRVLVLNQLYDTVRDDTLKEAVETLRSAAGTTVIVFTNRVQDLGLDLYLYLEAGRQRLFSDHESFAAARDGEGPQAPLAIAPPLAALPQQS